FLGEREEWTCSHEEWRADVERSRQEGETYTLEDRATVKAMYVQYGHAAQDVCRWVNCSVMALPTGMLYHTDDQNPCPPTPTSGSARVCRWGTSCRRGRTPNRAACCACRRSGAPLPGWFSPPCSRTRRPPRRPPNRPWAARPWALRTDP